MTDFRLLVTGSRDWTDRERVLRAIEFRTLGIQLDDLVVVHGHCPTGADAIADELAAGSGVRVERHPAFWAAWGQAAGPLRNQVMVDLGADLCLAFITGTSRGTLDCVRRAEAAGIPVIRYFEAQS